MLLTLPGLYGYAKALEDAECALLGGFFYQHFRLAATVIGKSRYRRLMLGQACHRSFVVGRG